MAAPGQNIAAFNNTSIPTGLPNLSQLTGMAADMGKITPATANAANINFDPTAFQTAESMGRQSISQQAGQNADAMARRFAAMGNMNSGAFVKQGQIADQQTQEALGQLHTNIGMQENQAQQQVAAENAGFTQQANLANAQMQQQAEIQAKQMGFEANSKISELQLAANKQQEDLATEQFNAEMAQYQAAHSGGLFGAGGFLGTGSWLCTERHRVQRLSLDEQIALLRLLKYSLQNAPGITLWYLTRGRDLVKRVKASDPHWAKGQNMDFIRLILSLLEKGEMSRAFTEYFNYVGLLCLDHWPEEAHVFEPMHKFGTS